LLLFSGFSFEAAYLSLDMAGTRLPSAASGERASGTWHGNHLRSQPAPERGDEKPAPGDSVPKVAGIGNVLRHEYEHVAHDGLWHVVQDDLPALETVWRDEAVTFDAIAQWAPVALPLTRSAAHPRRGPGGNFLREF
jgi:Protein of unknown function DUF86